MKFIKQGCTEINIKKRYPATYFRRRFYVKTTIVRASLKMTALGIYEPYINGTMITDMLLLPGFTNYDRRLQYQEFNVTKFIRTGENIIGVIVGDGWYRGNIGAFNSTYSFGKELKLAASLCITYTDGTTEIVDADECWEWSSEGPLRENDLKTLERYEAVRDCEWCKPDGQSAWSWTACAVSRYTGRLVPSTAEPVMEHEAFKPEVIRTPDGSTVLDFKQNLAGHVWFRVTGKAGHFVALTMGETLDTEGNFTLQNLQGKQKPGSALYVGQRLEYILKDGSQEYKSKFLISGYRYVKLENWPETVHPDNFRSIAIYSTLTVTGRFRCSNEKINRLVENVQWSQRSNFVDIPTDCPQRERAGWAGDINVYLETANYFTNTKKFIEKWMVDFVQAQKKDGSLPYIIPEVPALGNSHSSAGWSDAITTVGLMQYLFYDDKKIIADTYEAAKAYVEFNRKRAGKRHIFHILKRGKHYSYILDTGFHYGEWLEPGSSNIRGSLKAMIFPDSEVATAWFYYSAKNVAQMAALLNKPEDAKTYAQLAEKIKSAYQMEFVPKGKISSKRQCKYVRPIYMELLNKEEAINNAEQLNRMCIQNNYRIGTGFLTTYQILNVLTDYGYVDTAYYMLENEQCPGWLYEVNCKATTIWEGWDAITKNPDKIASLSQNHYSPGAAISWLFSRCAGIRPKTPGFQKVIIRPHVGGSLTWAEAEYHSIHGKIRSCWKLDNSRFILDVEISDNIDATIILPDQSVYEHAKTGKYSCCLK